MTNAQGNLYYIKSDICALASADNGMSQLLWPSIIVGIVAILVVLVIVIVMKQKWWMRANSQRNLEVCERNDYAFLSKLLRWLRCISASYVDDCKLYLSFSPAELSTSISTLNEVLTRISQ